MPKKVQDRPAPGIAAELARTKAALESANETISWQRREIDRLGRSGQCGRADCGMSASLPIRDNDGDWRVIMARAAKAR